MYTLITMMMHSTTAMRLGDHHFSKRVRYLSDWFSFDFSTAPEEHILSDTSTSAFLRIMPSV